MNMDDDSNEQLVRIPFPGNRIVICRIALGSNIVIGPGPRPKKDGAIMAQRVDETHVLTIETELVPAEAANISVGPGHKPG
ncbi:MAG: hypothetical protein JSR50_02740 [Proteobacteria bacterium]|nr:hypothetical protein [Pseudomonadota bacterium]